MKHPRPPATIRDLVSFRLHTLASFSARSADARFRLKFGIKLLEWRVLALLGGLGPLALKDVCREAQVEKAHASRTVAALIQRDLVHKGTSRSDQRALRLSLTPAGRALYRKAFDEAVRRSDAWLSVLTAEEQAVFIRCLDRMAVQARRLARETTALTRNRSRNKDDRRPPVPAARPAATLRIEPDAAQRLYRQLGVLLGAGT